MRTRRQLALTVTLVACAALVPFLTFLFSEKITLSDTALFSLALASLAIGILEFFFTIKQWAQRHDPQTRPPHNEP